MSKVMIEVDEDAVEKLDRFIHEKYSLRCFIRNVGKDDFYVDWKHEPSEYEKAEWEANEAKKLAKAFGLYPYNQPNCYSMEMETGG